MSITNNLFTLTMPDTWQEQTVHTFVGPEQEGVKHTLLLVIERGIAKDADLASFAKVRIELLRQSQPSFDILKEGERMVAETGLRLYEVVYRYAPHDDKIIYQKQVYTILGTRACTFCISFSKKTLKTMMDEVDRIIDSFALSQRDE